MPFSIEEYKNEAYCDILNMDACQLLFSRPWQFDVDAHHSGKDHTYLIKKDGDKFTLLPWKRRLKPKATSKETKKTLFTMA